MKDRFGRQIAVAKGELLVRFRPKTPNGERDDIVRAVQGDVMSVHGFRSPQASRSSGERAGNGEIYRLRVTGRHTREAIDQLLAYPQVLSAEPNPLTSSFDGAERAANDPLFEQQWGLIAIGAPAAWPLTAQSHDVTVAVIDTGIDASHPDLLGRVLPGFNVMSDGASAADANGHGTAVAGVIAAVSGNGKGIAGACPSCRILPIVAAGADGTGTYADLIAALQIASDEGTRVINISLGGTAYSQILADVVNEVSARGSVIVAAAGNEPTHRATYPAAFPPVIGVSGIQIDGTIAPDSSIGDFVRLAGPGTGIVTTSRGGSYITAGGTSLAAAFVSASAAMLAAAHDEMAAAEIEHALLATAEPSVTRSSFGGGFGVVRIDRAAAEAHQPFHDVAITAAGLSRDGTLVVTITNRGTFAESALHVTIAAAQASYPPQVVPRLSAGESVQVTVPLPATARVSPVMIHLDAVSDELDLHNNLALYFPSSPNATTEVLYKNRPFVHSWIAIKAADLLPTGAMKTEITQNLVETPLNLFDSSWIWQDQYPVPAGWDADHESGATIAEGAWEEDEHLYGLLPSSLRHFWNPDKGFNYGLYVCVQNDSAVNQAQQFWSDAIRLYPTNKPLAYYNLGRVAHLLEDMGVPEHVHCDQHPGNFLLALSDKDDYSNYEEYTKLFYRNYSASGTAKDYHNLAVSLPSTYTNSALDNDLSALFYNQAQFTQQVDAGVDTGCTPGTYDGNSVGPNGTTLPLASPPPYAHGRRSYPAVDYLKGCSSAPEQEKNESNNGIDPGTTISVYWEKASELWLIDHAVPLCTTSSSSSDICIDVARGKGQIMYPTAFWNQINNTLDQLVIKYIYRGSPCTATSLNPRDFGPYYATPDRFVSQQMTTLFPENIRYVAGLYKMFWDRTHQSAAAPTVTAHSESSAPSTNLSITFSRDMDDTTLNGSNIPVAGSSSGSHSGTYTFDHSTHVLTVNPSSDFSYSEKVTVTVGVAVKASDGTSLASPYPYSFWIQSAPSGNPTSISLTVSLSPGGTVAPGTWMTASGKVAYNTGASVPVGSVTVDTGENLYTIPISSGSYSGSFAAPTSSRWVTFTAYDSTYKLQQSTSQYVTVSSDGGGSSYTLSRHTVARSVQSTDPYGPVYETIYFRRSSDQALVWVGLTYVYAAVSVRFDFYDPQGNLYDSETTSWSNNPASYGYLYYTYWNFWSWISIRDHSASYLPGRWSCRVYINSGSGYQYRFTEEFIIGYEFTEHRMAKDVQSSSPYLPIDETKLFTQTDTKAVTWGNADNVSESLDVRWKFYEPNGSLYGSTTAISDDPGADYYLSWVRFSGWAYINGYAAMYKPGDWRVDVAIRDVGGNYQTIYTDAFRIIENPAIAPVVTTTLIPSAPKAGDSVTASINASDTYLKKIVLHWNDGAQHTQAWDDIYSTSYSPSFTLGSYSGGQSIEAWTEAWDTSGNHSESSHSTIYVAPPPPPNTAPAVYAGADRTIVLPDSIALGGVVSDDGLPNPPGFVTTIWSKVSGPGTVTFGDASNRDTVASFSLAGTYTLRLIASDNALSSSDDVVITVKPPCAPLPSPTSARFDSAGGNGAIIVEADTGCAWSATTSSTFVSLSGATGSGYGRIAYAVSPNTTTMERTATITVAGKSVTIVQLAGGPALTAGLPLAYSTLSNSSSDWKMVGAADFDNDGKKDLVFQNLATGMIVVWFMNGMSFRSDHVIGVTSDPLWRVVGVADFDRNGSADLLLQNAASGLAYVWLMSGTTVLSTNTYVGRTSSIEWRMAGVADLNHDGSVDIILQNRSTLQNAVWVMNGVNLQSTSTLLRSVSTSDWFLEAFGDVNGDGYDDIILRNVANGMNAVWYMDGLNVFSTDNLLQSVTDLNWRIGAAADFNGDGKLDLAWQNSMTHENGFWFMNGLNILPAMRPVLSNSSSDWKMVGAGDFDGDGRVDLLFQNYATGQLVVWAMNGTTALRTDLLLRSVADTTWRVVGVADFNHDHRPDILLQNSVSNLVYLWTMNGLVPFSTDNYIGRVAAGWAIRATADMDGDGSVDILLQNDTTRQLAVWRMNGILLVSTDNLISTLVAGGWTLRAAADLNGNGSSDLILRNDATGEVAVWLMNHMQVLSTSTLLGRVADTNWRIVTAADLDGDGNKDLLWQNSPARGNGVWLLNGTLAFR